MNYCEIKKYDIANGPGVRVSLFVSGCRHHCLGCFQPETWDFNYGKPFTEDTIKEIIDAMSHEWISGLTLLGGDPLEPENIEGLIPLLQQVKKDLSDKTIWLYTGCKFDDVCKFKIMEYVDVVVDGEFILDEKDISLVFKGSRNQRIIDVKKSLAADKIILFDLDS